MLGLLYGYWYLTNDQHVRRKAKWYLRSLTNAHVTVGDAHFRVFGGIELRDVRAYIRHSDAQPFFYAPHVVLRHEPLALLRGKVRPTVVVLNDPEVIIEHDRETGRYNFQDLLTGARRQPVLGRAAFLPTIRVRRCKQRLVEITGALREQGDWSTWDATLTPGDAVYEIAIEQQAQGGGKGITGVGELDLVSGALEWRNLSASIPSIAGALSRQYQQWCRQYQVRGDIRLAGEIDPATSGPVELELVDVSLRLPKDQGGLALETVAGRLTFHRSEDGSVQRVVLSDLTGRIEQGDAQFRLSGSYDGVDSDSPFDMRLSVRQLTIPTENPASGPLGRTFDTILRWFTPRGTVDADVRMWRDKGDLGYHGMVRPRGVTITYNKLPCKVHDVQGTIEFSPQGLRQIALRGRRQGGSVEITGHASAEEDPWTYDITVRADEIGLDDELRAALPERYTNVWEKFSPQGRASAIVRVHRQAGEGGPLKEQFDVAVIGRGQLSVSYEGFPYRVSNVFGRAEIRDGRAHIDAEEPIRGRAGPMRCTIYGDLANLTKPPLEIDLTIEANQLPLDEALYTALGEGRRESLDTLGLSGWADVVVHLAKKGDEPLDYRAQADLARTSFRLEVLPRPIGDAVGKVIITPQRVQIESLEGIYDRTPIHVSGQMLLNEPMGIDLAVDSPSVHLDRAISEVTSPAIRKIYEQFTPKGRAGLNVVLRRNMPDQPPDQTAYRVMIRPKDLRLRYRGFPYPVRAVSGLAVATPGRIELKRILTRKGDMQAIISGTVLLDDAGEQASLQLQARSVPIDEGFLGAIPGDLATLANRLQPGGTCDLNLSKLNVLRLRPPGRADPEEGAGGAKDDDRITWDVEGSLTLADAVVDLGLGVKSVSGKLRGVASRSDEGMEVRATIALSQIQIGQHKLTDLTGKLMKARSGNILHVRDLIGRCHGGRAAGFAEIRLADPVEYGVNLSVESVDLNDLFNAGIQPPAARSKATGRLAGTMQLVATSGKNDTRKASGVLQISQAKLYKMPIVLGLLHVVFLSLPGDSAFSDGTMTYHMNGDKLVFDEIYLTGPSLSIVGSGTMNIATEKINFTFLAGPPGKLPRLGHLDEFVQNVIRELVEIQITGTLRKPETRTVPLRGVDAVVRRMLQPAGQEE
jgi:hypothetical protein